MLALRSKEMIPAAILDKLIEAPIVPSFSRIGYEARRRIDDWTELGSYDVSGRVMVLTGATSGLGKAAALQLARCGATLVLVGRTESKNVAVVNELVDQSGNQNLSHFAADMGNYEQVRALAKHVLEHHPRLDVLMHNAGALADVRREAPDGTEATVASQVIGPFLLTQLLLDRLSASAPARVITMSSGGMYSAPLTVSRLEMNPATYKGAEQYARAKRAQVTLTQLWAQRYPDSGIRFHSLHPGWADTPGVAEALPGFRKVMRPILRSPNAGADTMVWLAVSDEALATNGVFWHDRRPRSVHKLPTTRKADTAERRDQLWEFVTDKLAQ